MTWLELTADVLISDTFAQYVACTGSRDRARPTPYHVACKAEFKIIQSVGLAADVSATISFSIYIYIYIYIFFFFLGLLQGSTVAFLDLHYYIYLRGRDSSGGEKAWNSTEGPAGASGKREAHVLKGVTGVLLPSEMAAILGECLTVGGVGLKES